MTPLTGLALLAIAVAAGIWLGTRMERARRSIDSTTARFFDGEAINDAAENGWSM